MMVVFECADSFGQTTHTLYPLISQAYPRPPTSLGQRLLDSWTSRPLDLLFGVVFRGSTPCRKKVLSCEW